MGGSGQGWGAGVCGGGRGAAGRWGELSSEEKWGGVVGGRKGRCRPPLLQRQCGLNMERSVPQSSNRLRYTNFESYWNRFLLLSQKL